MSDPDMTRPTIEEVRELGFIFGETAGSDDMKAQLDARVVDLCEAYVDIVGELAHDSEVLATIKTEWQAALAQIEALETELASLKEFTGQQTWVKYQLQQQQDLKVWEEEGKPR